MTLVPWLFMEIYDCAQGGFFTAVKRQPSTKLLSILMGQEVFLQMPLLPAFR